MANVANNTEGDIMRAITHARMHVTSGQGLESIVHDLSTASLGAVSAALALVIREINAGRDADHALATVAEQVTDDNLRTFLQALRAPGAAAVSRLDDLSTTVQEGWQFAAETYGTRVSRLVQAAAILFIISFVPSFLRIPERIPDNPLGFTFEFPAALESIVFTTLASLITLLLVLMRVR